MINPEDQVEENLAKLKVLLGAETDSDLARLLSLDRRTVSGWRARKSIPERYLAMLHDHAASQTPAFGMNLSEVDRAALSLALFRHARARADAATSEDFGKTWRAFWNLGAFFEMFMLARRDIARELQAGASVDRALTHTMLQDVEQAEETTGRDQAICAKWDNPEARQP